MKNEKKHSQKVDCRILVLPKTAQSAKKTKRYKIHFSFYSTGGPLIVRFLTQKKTFLWYEFVKRGFMNSRVSFFL